MIKEADNRILSLLPDTEKKKVAAIRSKPSQDEVLLAEQELLNWEASIRQIDQTLTNISNSSDIDASSDKKQATQNNTNNISIVGGDSPTKVIPIRGSTASPSPTTTNKPSNNDISIHKQRLTHNIQFIDKTLSQRYNHHISDLTNLSITLNINPTLSLTDRNRLAEHEKRKGNEYFKSNDYDKALLYYAYSLTYNNTNSNIYTNRALTNLKMKLYDAAELDCHLALFLDGCNTKGWLRRAKVFFEKGLYKQVRMMYLIYAYLIQFVYDYVCVYMSV